MSDGRVERSEVIGRAALDHGLARPGDVVRAADKLADEGAVLLAQRNDAIQRQDLVLADLPALHYDVLAIVTTIERTTLNAADSPWWCVAAVQPALDVGCDGNVEPIGFS